MSKVTPFLMFNTGVKDAFEFYHSIFKNSQIISMSDMGGAHSGEIEIEGQRIIGFDGGDHFKFTDGFSLMIDCKDQAEVDYYYDKLLSDGGCESQCGWVTDRFGLSWQVVPSILTELLGDPDPARAQRALQAMMQMKKLDIKKLQDAAEGR
jgi:predicted 3-demethylubiquinone-9 3-methyltransferase (glyoxalase superfamily)